MDTTYQPLTSSASLLLLVSCMASDGVPTRHPCSWPHTIWIQQIRLQRHDDNDDPGFSRILLVSLSYLVDDM